MAAHIAGWRLTKTNKHSGLVQSLHKLPGEFLAKKYVVSSDISEVFFSVVFHISIYKVRLRWATRHVLSLN